ncbi:fk506 suppressor [Ophiostoma piceae UAMH 11346]|uniref:Fk506 suppressor n=1 Tax=Ophiostoma piceae (strain UAMH 11346) TaxID=1262450 RepID=S3CBR7_OPHP1|nr:fk506 suppressor [Ophiostoma piceae UAMH 11346]
MISRFSYWLLPIFSGAVWLGMLLGMILGWVIDLHREHTISMDDGQYIPYISDIGATSRFKPMFIALSAVTTASLDLSFLADRWLRHSGRLTPNGSRGQKVLAVLAILFAIVGTAGLILLSVFDVAHHHTLHDAFLLCFLGGYVLSAIFICWEYQRLGIHNRHLRILALSFWIKLSFVLIEVLLAIVFVSLTFTDHTNGGAAVEWVIAVFFAFYVFSFCIDLYPAVHTRHAHGDVEKNGTDNIGLSSAERTTGSGAPIADSHNNNNAPVMAQEQSPYYGDAYGQSAARATRAPRYNRMNNNTSASNANDINTTAPVENHGPVGSAFTEGDFEHSGSVGSEGQIIELPADAYQPGRAY